MAAELTAVQRVRARELSHVLGAADRHDVWLEPDGTSVETCAEVFGLSDPIGDVTEEVGIAESAGLLVARPLRHGSGASWDLTEAGAVALAELRSTVNAPKPSEATRG